MKKTLLVIEDENSVAKQLRWGLDKEYDITIAYDTSQATPPFTTSLKNAIMTIT